MMIQLAIALTALVAQAEPPAEPTIEREGDWVYLQNDHLRIGVDNSRGGAVGYLAPLGGQSVVNRNDTGRFVQQSYYGDVDGSDWDGKPWRYNPVQGGSWDNTPGRVEAFTTDDHTLYTRTTPCNWARPGQYCPEAVMEQWITLEGNIAHLRYKLTYTGPTQQAPRHQEMPAVFVDYLYNELVHYTGDAPWTGGELTRTPVQGISPPRNETARATEHWSAYAAPDGRAVAVYTPGTEVLTYYRFRGDNQNGPNAGACSYFAPLRNFTLEQGLVLEYDVYLTLGTIEQARDRFAAIREAREEAIDEDAE